MRAETAERGGEEGSVFCLRHVLGVVAAKDLGENRRNMLRALKKKQHSSTGKSAPSVNGKSAHGEQRVDH